VLSEEGQRYLPGVRDAFDRLVEATDRLRQGESSGTLTVSFTHSFGSKWLMPRLMRFSERQPTISVRMSANDALTDFARDGVDLAIRYGRGDWPGVRADLLLEEEFFPVCSPRLLKGNLLKGKKPLKAPADLLQQTLLTEIFQEAEVRAGEWRTWFRAAGLGDRKPPPGPTFSHGAMMVAAAIEGLGVALARSTLVADDLAAERLVKPFDIAVPGEWAHYVVSPKATADRPKVAAFREWLLFEAGQRA
jgi:LysR family glycine cleavage system transcriptional activator